MKYSFNIFLILSIWFSAGILLKAQPFKQKMEDHAYNFHEVVAEAEAYYLSVPASEKHGYKTYQRWKYFNGFKYSPDGFRDIDGSKKFQSLAVLERKAHQRDSPFHEWKESGPLMEHQANTIDGGGMGRVDFYYVDPQEENLIYLATRGGSFWRSEDGGQNWIGSTTDSLFTGFIRGMSVAPSNNQKIYLKVQNVYAQGLYSEQGIYVSDDGGNSWEVKPMNDFFVNYAALHFMTIDPNDENIVYINNGQQLYKTTDGFETFSLVSMFENEAVFDVKFHPINEDQIFITTRNDLYRSDDNGISFSYISSHSNSNFGGNRRIVIPQNWSNQLYVVTIDALYKSSNFGVDLALVYSAGGGSIWSFAPSEIDSNRLIYGEVGLYISDDGGHHFQGTDKTTVIHGDVRNLQHINGHFYAGTDGYLSKSVDEGESWEVLNRIMNIRENYAVNISQSHVNTYTSGSQDNGTELQSGDQLTKVGGGDGMTGVIHPLNRNLMITASQKGARSLTIDAGITRYGVSRVGQLGVWNAPVISNYMDFSQIYTFLEGLVFKEELMGLREELIFEDDDLRIFAADIAYNNSNIFAFAGKSGGFGLDTNFIFISDNGGQSFQKTSVGLPIENLVSNLSFSPTDDSTIVAVYGTENTDESIFITHNLGQTWENITFDLEHIPILAVAIDHLDDNNIYIGTSLGVFTKKMAEQSWNLYSNKLPKVEITDLHIHFGSNQLFAATYGRGTWTTNLIEKETAPRIEAVDLSVPPDLFRPNPSDDLFVETQIVYNEEITDAYILYSINNLSLDNRIELNHSTENTWLSAASFPDGEIGDKIYFKLVAKGQNGAISESFRYMYGLKKKDYCDQLVKDFTIGNQLYLKEFSLDDLHLVKTTGLGFYNLDEDYDLSLNQGEAYTIEALTRSNFANAQVELLVVFDWNNDLAFDIDTESYYLGSNPPNSEQATSNSPLTFVVPMNVATDSVRMRILLQNRGNASYETLTYNLCSPGAYTEVLDLTVAISNFTNTDDLLLDNTPLQIHPNPTNGLLFVEGIDAQDFDLIEVYNLSGKKISVRKVSDNNRLQLDVSHLPSSVYHIVLNKGGKKISIPFVKVD